MQLNLKGGEKSAPPLKLAAPSLDSRCLGRIQKLTPLYGGGDDKDGCILVLVPFDGSIMCSRGHAVGLQEATTA